MSTNVRSATTRVSRQSVERRSCGRARKWCARRTRRASSPPGDTHVRYVDRNASWYVKSAHTAPTHQYKPYVLTLRYKFATHTSALLRYNARTWTFYLNVRVWFNFGCCTQSIPNRYMWPMFDLQTSCAFVYSILSACLSRTQNT